MFESLEAFETSETTNQAGSYSITDQLELCNMVQYGIAAGNNNVVTT